MTFSIRSLCAAALAILLFLPATSLARGGGGGEVSAGPITASVVTHDSARVTGTLVPADKQTTWWIQYGASLNAVKSTQPVTVPGDRNHRSVTVTATLSGLPAGTLVYARLVAEGSGDHSDGDITSFRTAAAPAPTVPGDGTPGPGGTPDPGSPAAPSPALGESFVAAVEQGSVRVRVPGSGRFVALDAATSVPVGSIVDARSGTIALSAALAGGDVQSASFWGARFKVRQSVSGGGRTDLHLRGGSFAGCGRERDRALASAAGQRRKKVRRLWGKDDGGRFRTHGRDSVATVRGTQWSMTDRCDGTVTRVTQGAVDVKVSRTGRVVRVRAGEHHFAGHRR